jgi:oligopeptidase B
MKFVFPFNPIKPNLVWLLILVCLSVNLNAMLRAPKAEKIPLQTTHNGQTLVDNYAWLRDRSNPKVLKLLKQENKYAKQQMKASKGLADSLYKEYLAATDYSQNSYPYLEKGYYYYSETQKGKAYPVHYRYKNVPGAVPSVVLDENHLAKGKTFFALGVYAISPDQRYLAYSTDVKGDENYTLFLKDLEKGQTKSLGVEQISDFAWCADSHSYFYITTNERWQSDRCWLADILDPKGKLQYQELNPYYDLSFYKSSDRSKIFLLSYGKEDTEVRVADATRPERGFEVFWPLEQGLIYYPDFMNGNYYIHTNFSCADMDIQTSSDSLPALDWRSLVAGKDGEPISTFQLFTGHLAVIRRLKGFEAIQIYKLPEGKLLDTIKPDRPSDLDFWHNGDINAPELFYSLENEVTPYTIYKYSFATQSSEQVYQEPIHTKFKPEEFTSQICYVPVSDSVSIPLRLVYKKDLDLSKPHPLWLSGYGAYGDTEDPYFSVTRFSVLSRGLIYAVANVRGGGELGDKWYQQGKLLNKPNSFSDLSACVDYLLARNYTTSRQLAIEGGSAGGLLVGATANLAAEKLSLVVTDVPFVDVLNTMLDDTLPLTQQEYDEWGNPDDPIYFDCIKQYSPYENVQPKAYPAFLISTAWNDTRVGYWEALKWAYKLRENTTSTNPIIYRIYWHEGHTGTTDRFQSLRFMADQAGFILNWLRKKQ